MATNVEVKVELNATEILGKLWPTMLFAIIIMIIIGVGGYLYGTALKDEIHLIIAMYVWLFASCIIYLGSVVLFFIDIKKMAQVSLPSNGIA